MLADEKGRWALQPHTDHQSEYAPPTTIKIPTEVTSVIDRTFVDEGTRWIIDYKFSSRSLRSLEEFTQRQTSQYQSN